MPEICLYAQRGSRGFIATASTPHITNMNDPYDLQRFVDAQNPVFEDVCSELRDGDKRGHWMWFIFPQLKGLGHSQAARDFAISSLQEAAAYLQHPVLGPRLRQCCLIVTLLTGRSVDQIFGYPDDLKFRSSMTLFAHATSENQIFMDALRKYFGNEFDPLTLTQLSLAKVGEPLGANNPGQAG